MPMARVTSGVPVWENGVYRQTFVVEADLAIPPDCFDRCFKMASDLFRAGLAAKGMRPEDYKWPPSDVKMDSASNMQAGFVTFETRSKRPPDEANHVR